MKNLEEAKAELRNLYNKCSSNDEFDKYQPDILCQIDAINELIYLELGDVDQDEFNDIIDMIKALKSEWIRCSNKVEIPWVYG